MDERYLWDRTGPADPEVERLESLLGRYRRQGGPVRLPEGRPGRRSWIRPCLAAAAVLATVAGALWIGRSAAATRWRVETIEGAPSVGSARIAGVAALAVGQKVETDAGSRAKIGVGRFAEITIAPRSRVRLVKAGPVEQRLALDRGRISAKIWAPPRLFFVETPSALAVDLGCAYTLEVDEAGAGLLRVETGWVSFERDGRESLVPAGAVCSTRRKEGPGTPYYEDAPAPLREALGLYDFAGAGEEVLSTILREARKRDGLTLWHLLVRARSGDRARVYERLTQLVPPPPAVTREGALGGDARMLERWRWELDGMPLLPREGTFWSFCRKVWFRLAA
jgi:hypothetical protein